MDVAQTCRHIKIYIYNWLEILTNRNIIQLKLAKYKYISNFQDMLAKNNIIRITKI